MPSANLACVIAIAAGIATGCAEHGRLLVVRPPVGGNVPYVFWPPPPSTSFWAAGSVQGALSFGEIAQRIDAAMKAAA